MRKLIREELIKRGYRVDHETESMSVFDKDDKRVILTPSGRCQIWRKSGLRWRIMNEVVGFSKFLTLLRAGARGKRGRDSETKP